jgi:stage II sporulation protein E
MYQVLYRFLQSLQHGGGPNENKGELSQYCPYTEELVEQVLLVFEKAHLNMAWYNRLQENRDAIAQQLNAMAYIMEDCAKQDRDITGEEGRLAAQIRYAFKERGIVVEHLHILEMRGAKLKIQFFGRTKGSKCISVREMAKIISRITGRSFSPAKDCKALLGETSVSIAFLENSRLTAYYGVARAVREDQNVSGDNFSFQMLDGGKCVMSVSDGMGSGYGACKESEMVIDLIEKFMEAGFMPDMALRMMNSAMVTHGDNNLFSTVDLMYLDLDTGEAEFYKIGAVATFIRGKDGVRCVDCISMPVGVFAGQKVPKCEEKLESGEFVVMVTDGVLEHLPTEHAKETVMEIIRGVETNNPAEFSRSVLDQVLLFTGGRVRDDMTVLTAGIWKN